MNIDHGDPESITDGCSSEDCPEVELVSMLEEQLPQYKLRVDTLYPYDNQDWLQAPSCYSHVPQTISPVLAEETFRYMKLGGQRAVAVGWAPSTEGSAAASSSTEVKPGSGVGGCSMHTCHGSAQLPEAASRPPTAPTHRSSQGVLHAAPAPSVAPAAPIGQELRPVGAAWAAPADGSTCRAAWLRLHLGAGGETSVCFRELLELFGGVPQKGQVQDLQKLLHSNGTGYSLKGPPHGGCALSCLGALSIRLHTRHFGICAHFGIPPTPESAQHHSPALASKKRSKSTGPLALQKKGALGKGPVLGHVPTPELLGDTSVVGPPSPARDPPPTPGSSKGSQPLIRPSLPEAGLAAKAILGTDRVEQMTKTYNDIDMVTHLLAEVKFKYSLIKNKDFCPGICEQRDRDLELAARIGQALLKRNHALTEQNEVLEEQLGQAFDQVNQLQHELSKKDELLRIVSIASEESETDSSCSTPLRFNDSFNLSHGLLQLDVLQDKLRELEEENLALRSKACHLKTETITYEVKEQELVSDCVKELRETHAQIARMTEELSGKSEELTHYQEEISTLLSQIVDLQHKLKEHVIEKEELKLHLQASKDAQRQLTGELHELQDRNAECLGLLHELQEEVKELRSRASPAAHLCRPQSCGAFPLNSLAAEIEGTMRMELIQDEESAPGKQKDLQKRVFDTVKVANVTRGRSSSFPAQLLIPGSNRSSVIMTAKPFQSGLQQVESKAHLNQRSSSKEISKDNQKLGQPGTPGDNDLATALHTLHLRQQNYLSEKRFFEEEWERKMHLLADQKEEAGGCCTPVGSCLSVGANSEFTDFSGGSPCLRLLLPEKLQIVKPLEGSQTLFHWQQLAQPNLGTILDPRPGVVTKGFTPLPEDAIYHISDLEEDEEEGEGGITFQVQQAFLEEGTRAVPKPEAGIFLPPLTSATVPLAASNPGKCLSSTNSTFTFTTCRILHPSDVTQVTPSSMYTPLSFGSSGNSTGNTTTSGEFIEISPGYTLTRSKEHLSVTLGEEFFERKRTTEEPAPPFVPREDIITDLEEQIAELTDMMEQLCRDHQASRKLLEKDMEEKCNEMQQEHENKIRELQEAHCAELQALQVQCKKELRTERASAQEKMEVMQKEYRYLKNAFRMYQDSVSDETEEKWLRRQAEWKKSERTEREKALLKQKQELMKTFEMEREQLKKSSQGGNSMMNKLYQQEREKSNLMELEKNIQQKISAVELKHQLNITSLTDENAILRRKLITKSEEAYNERVRRKSHIMKESSERVRQKSQLSVLL
ncbi:Trafficking kinesin-binding protein 2 [Chelonia mydas]|uniref:Trafficking kinesin-binding protein 2 n=1 Tax=Chelonia mydas TaxID=8469 RepID=M7B7W9_CHEMY|nr:Trafficking kinesin-binding protein 2 [Chelonia mydas]